MSSEELHMLATSIYFATAVLEAFDKAGLATDTEISAAGGPSSTTMTKLRKAAAGEHLLAEPRNDTYRRIELAARWAPGSARALWRDGAEPQPRRRGLADAVGVEATKVAPQGLDAYLQGLEQRITELEERVDLLDVERQRQFKEARDRAVHGADQAGTELPRAARKMKSAGRAARAAQDEDAETS